MVKLSGFLETIKRGFVLIVVVLFLVFLLFGIPYLVTRSLLGIPLFFGVLVAGFFITRLTRNFANRLGERIRQASPEESRKEDDVLLQAVALSQSVFFIYLNLIPSSDFIVAFKILVPALAASFYVLRAWAKITDNARFRYWSIWLFFFIVVNSALFFSSMAIASILGIEKFVTWGYLFGSLCSSILFGSMLIIGGIFKKRYGLSD
jgi:hypothetical protein